MLPSLLVLMLSGRVHVRTYVQKSGVAQALGSHGASAARLACLGSLLAHHTSHIIRTVHSTQVSIETCDQTCSQCVHCCAVTVLTVVHQVVKPNRRPPRLLHLPSPLRYSPPCLSPLQRNCR